MHNDYTDTHSIDASNKARACDRRRRFIEASHQTFACWHAWPRHSPGAASCHPDPLARAGVHIHSCHPDPLVARAGVHIHSCHPDPLVARAGRVCGSQAKPRLAAGRRQESRRGAPRRAAQCVPRHSDSRPQREGRRSGTWSAPPAWQAGLQAAPPPEGRLCPKSAPAPPSSHRSPRCRGWWPHKCLAPHTHQPPPFPATRRRRRGRHHDRRRARHHDRRRARRRPSRRRWRALATI